MTKKNTKRTFGSGAYRDQDKTKLQYRRCLSHRVLKSFAEFMRKHNTMTDGTRRNEENWKKGFPQESFMDSKFRHFMYSWEVYEEFGDIKELIESLNAELFNVMGWLDLLLKPGMTIKKFRKSMGEVSKPGMTIKKFRKALETVHYVPCIKSKIGTRRSNLTKCGLNRTRSSFNVTTKIEKVTCEDCKDLLKKRKVRPDKTSQKAFNITSKPIEDAYEGMQELNGRKRHYYTGNKKDTGSKIFCGYYFNKSDWLTTKDKKKVTCADCLGRLAALSRAKSSVEADEIIAGKKRKIVHYKPLGRINTPICGCRSTKIKTTPHHYHANCKTCKKIIDNWKH
jgi:hypothetical protein